MNISLVNKILRPIKKVSLGRLGKPFGRIPLLTVEKCVPKAEANEDITWLKRKLWDSESRKERFGRCKNAVYDDPTLCKYHDSMENNQLPLYQRALMGKEECISRPKCEWSGTECKESSKQTACAAAIHEGVNECEWRNSEDYELIQQELTQELSWHMQEVNQPPDVAYMNALQLITNIEKPKAATDNYYDEREAARLVHAIGHEFHMGCQVAKRIIRRSGLKRFKILTGLRRVPRCTMTRQQR